MSVVLLLTDDEGDTMGVPFGTQDEARAWQDEHQLEALGVARLVLPDQALREVDR